MGEEEGGGRGRGRVTRGTGARLAPHYPPRTYFCPAPLCCSSLQLGASGTRLIPISPGGKGSAGIGLPLTQCCSYRAGAGPFWRPLSGERQPGPVPPPAPTSALA